MSEHEIHTLTEICERSLVAKKLNNLQYSERLKFELHEIEIQDEVSYFLDLYKKQCKFPQNENNLLVAFLLDLVDHVDIEQEPASVQGEFPDIDIDYLEVVRDYLKNEWAPKTFGADKVCSIGTYITLGLKSVILDMARVYSQPREEALAITKQIPDKDDDNKPITFETALNICKPFAEYCKKYPEIADAASRLIHKNKSFGTHAAGLIISSVPLDNFVPLQIGKEGIVASAWTEGQREQDLAAVGLVKIDALVLKNNEQIRKACELIKRRHGLQSICALPGYSDWSDTTYLNDPDALALANHGDLIGIFQFESDGMRMMVRSGGVTSFDDLVAYTALYRPGPLSMKMHERYINRKQGKESYEIHPLMQPILKKTYGVMVYQEQIAQILNKVGGIPLRDCEAVRKAISKKKIDKFQKYKDMFVLNGQSNLGMSAEEVSYLWDQVEAFAGYGFNLSHSVAYTYISSRLLWLKAHYPLEFYTALLISSSLAEDIKEYKLDAFKHHIEVQPLDLNLSKEDFDIVDGHIRYGFSKIKGIGLNVAEKIVQKQPYDSFADFLARFGMNANALKALIGLGCFGKENRLRLYRYANYLKDHLSKRYKREHHYEKKMAKYDSDLVAIVGKENAKFDDFSCELKWRQMGVAAKANKIKNSRETYLATYRKSTQEWNDKQPSFDDFPFHEVKVKEDITELLELPLEESERRFYGFIWTHPLEKCKDYQGWTFDRFNRAVEYDGLQVGCVEVQIMHIEDKKSVKGTTYWVLTVEDANSERQWIQMWANDYAVWRKELQEGNLVRLRVQPPTPPWRRYLFQSFPRNTTIDKDADYRLVLLE